MKGYDLPKYYKCIILKRIGKSDRNKQTHGLETNTRYTWELTTKAKAVFQINCERTTGQYSKD